MTKSGMYLLALIGLIVLSGCDHKQASAVPAAPTSSEPTVASCAPFDLEWGIERNMATPTVTLRSVPPYELLDLTGPAGNGGGGNDTSGAIWFTVQFNASYQVRGQVNGCWSNWFPFVVGPPNPNGNATEPQPAPPCVQPNGRKCGDW